MNPTFTVTVTDTIGGYSSYLTPIKENALVAARDWGQFITGSGQIDIQINIKDSAGIADGASTYTDYTWSTFEGRRAVEVTYGSFTEIMTGTDPNGATSDITINIEKDYLHTNAGGLWFDSNPYDQTHVVPTNLLDSLLVLTHEIGHGFGFSGFRNTSTGILNEYVASDGLSYPYFTSYDSYVTMSGGNAYFNGSTAKSAYGAAVPLTSAILHPISGVYHFGNSTGVGADLYSKGVMHPTTSNGQSLDLSILDLSILKDLGYNVSFDDNIFRFFNRSTGTHFYTANIDEKNNVKTNLSNFNYEGVAFQTEATAQTGHAVYRFYNTTLDSHFYTISDYERDFVRQNLSNYQYESQVFYAYENNSSGDHEALYRFFNTATGTHFYTASVVERDSVVANLPSFKYEGIGFYIE